MSLFETSGIVSFGTLDYFVDLLIKRCGTYDDGSYNYQEVFLTTCAEFTNADELFQKLTSRFYDTQNPHINEIRSNIISLIADWLQRGDLPPSQELLGRMQLFCRDAVTSASSDDALTQAIQRLEILVFSEIQKSLFPPSNPHENGLMLHSPILDPIDLARCLTLLEGDNFLSFRAGVYIPHIQRCSSDDIIGRICETNKRITAWVSWSILEDDRLNKRTENMEYFIKTAVECQQLGNLSSAMAVALALHSGVVQALRETRNGLSWDKKRKLSRLSKLVDRKLNSFGYRQALRKAFQHGRLVPWLAFHLEELEKISEAEPTHLEGQRLINFKRSNAFMGYLREIEGYRPPDLETLRRQGQLAYVEDKLHRINLVNIDNSLLKRSAHLMRLEHLLKMERTRRTGLNFGSG